MFLDVQFKDHKAKQTCVSLHKLEATLMDTVAKGSKHISQDFLSSFGFLLPPKFIHFFPDNRMDAATKSRTSEDILRSSRLSTYSPEPYSQSECDYYPYASSPKGSKLSLQFTVANCITGCFLLLFFSLFLNKQSCTGSLLNLLLSFVKQNIFGLDKISFICFSFFCSAYRMPRRRFSTGGDEESWSHGLQRVGASLFSFFLQQKSHLHT